MSEIPDFITEKLPGRDLAEKIELLKADIQYVTHSEINLQNFDVLDLCKYAKSAN